MSRFAVIDNDSNEVVNIIIYDEEHEYYDKTVYLVQSDSANIHDIYDKLSQSFNTPIIEIDIEVVRTNLLNNLSNALTIHENQGTYFNGSRFPTDNTAQVKYLAILLTATLDPTFTTVFKTMDGEYVNLTALDIMNLCNTIRGYIKNCYEHDDYLTTLIKNADTVDKLNAINIDLGWPSTADPNPQPDNKSNIKK